MTHDNRAEKPARVEPEEARQGEIGTDGHVRGPMRYVLIISTIGVIVALIIAYVLV